MTQRITGALGALLAGITVLATPAHAATELVTNGSFEAGTFAGWTGTGETVFNGVTCPGSAAIVSSGSCSAFFGATALGGIQQVLNLGSAGLPWTLSFSLMADGASPSSASVTFGGQTLLSLSNPLGGGYQSYSFSGTSTSANMTLAFNFLNPNGYFYLDAVSVTAVPEPATTAMLTAGLMGLFIARRRRRA